MPLNTLPISTRKFKVVPNPNGTFKDIQPNFGIIKGLHLEYLEFPSKIKAKAPTIPEPSYSGKIEEEVSKPPPPVTGTAQFVKVSVKESHSLKKTPQLSEEDIIDEYEEEDDTEAKEFYSKFASDTPTPKASATEKKKEEKAPKFVQIPEVVIEEPEIDPQEQQIKDEVERRININALKKAKAAGKIPDEITDDMDLQTTRILRATIDKERLLEESISMNKFGLMGLFFATDMAAGYMTEKMKGYFDFQMKIMDTYDPYLEAIGETSFSWYWQQLDPSLQLGGVVVLSSGAFFLLQNYIGEDKVRSARLLQTFFPGKADAIEKVAQASAEIKKEKASQAKKKRRGPSYSAAEVNNMDG
jgi:hypothetical protein